MTSLCYHVSCNGADFLNVVPCRLAPLETTTLSLVEEAAAAAALAAEQHHPHDSSWKSERWQACMSSCKLAQGLQRWLVLCD